ncbi:hypothetical protein [Methylomagnum sp.]
MVDSVSPEIEEPEEPPQAGPAFNAEQLRRLGELRAWLARRRVQRDRSLPLTPELNRARNMTVYSDRQLLTPLGQRYAVGFQSRRNEPGSPPMNQGNPVLHIGRGADGRIHHRYVFSDAEQEANPPPVYAADVPSGRTSPRQSLPKGTGTIQSGQRIMRIWTPEPADQRAAPRLEYELPDQRR